MRQYESGLRGEESAERTLLAKGMTVLSRRYRAEDGEIDLIAQDGVTIVFVEVKARPQSRAGQGLMAVTPAKQRRICHAAMRYLIETERLGAPVRFDVVEITRDGILHIANAFAFIE